jgi:uncharacterized membrane protein YfcA
MGEIIALVLIGLAGGFAAGMLGIGGGTIYIPAMVLLLHEQQHLAQGASLAAIVAAAITGSIAHLRRGNVELPATAWVTPPAVVMGFIAALIADQLDPDVLRRIFAVVIVYFALLAINGAVRARTTPLPGEGS